jgi:hypothetical protein
MSMNLIFEVKGSSAYVDFPFQTPTDLTYAVIREKDIEKRIELIRNFLNTLRNKDANAYLMVECDTLMRDDKLELTYL